jgi:DNA helicase-2/ATP-dependent DNA helicase PcrA
MYAEPRSLSLLEAARQLPHISAIKGKAARGLTEFAKLMHDLHQLIDAPADEIIRQVLDRSGYRDMLKNSKDPDDQERLANIEELITAAHEFGTEDEDNGLAPFLEHVALVSDVDAWDETQDKVSIMTLHAAKGLEFPIVYIIGMEEGLAPMRREPGDFVDEEEERRLCFVGITRARARLTLTHACFRQMYGATRRTVRSPFLDEIPAEAVEYVRSTVDEGGGSPEGRWRRPEALDDESAWSVGTLVRHPVHGLGRIAAIQRAGRTTKADVRFRNGSAHRFVLEFSGLERVDFHEVDEAD